MCGIAGIVNLEAGPQPARSTLQDMIQALKHRGPDGFGFYESESAGFAHARLSIIDLQSGDQPIRNEDGSVWVVFNGEIFNHVELRATLERAGHRFYTHSDTEVIVHAYEEYGDDFVDHLNGQFAIALHDRRRRRVVLARDRVGIRPLFYSVQRGQLVFASEAKALFSARLVEPRLDPVVLAQIFTYWTPLPDCTPFVGVKMLPPGHLCVIENGQVRLRRYWDWNFSVPPEAKSRGIEECAEELRALLIDAVRLQLRADVPVGAYLSGGLDSSAIAALVRRYTDTPLRTFSVCFSDPEFDETSYQRELVEALGTAHASVQVSEQQIGASFPRAVLHMETPVVRTAPVPLMLLAQLVRANGYKVVLTGEGADEVFAGYDLFKEAKVRRFWAQQPQSKWRPALLKRLYPYLARSPVAAAAMAAGFFGQGLDRMNAPTFSHEPRWNTTARVHSLFSADMRATIGGFDARKALEPWLPAELPDWAPLGRDQYLEATLLLPGYLLSSQADRVAMASSIEGRFPFLDHRVIEFAGRLPPAYKMRGLNEKLILRRAVRDIVPGSILSRTKQPYRAPDSASFFSGGKALAYVEELLGRRSLKDAGYFEAEAVERLLTKCRAGRAIGFADNMAFVGVLSTMLLHELFVRRNLSFAAAA